MNPRMILWAGLLALAWLNFTTWMKDYGSVVRETPAAPAQPANGSAGPQDGLSAEVPAVTGEAPAPGPTTTATPGPESVAGAIRQSGKVHIVTDVLDLDASLAGGDLIRADIRQYPQHKDDPKKTPVRLFHMDSPQTRFLFQSGLTTGEASRITRPSSRVRRRNTAWRRAATRWRCP
jgi:YidC/Oxa1 family membrane protein insertase